MKLRREQSTIETSIGSAEVKLVYEGDQLLRITPEHASCRQLSEACGKALPEVYRIVTTAANRLHGLEE
jgi:uncharacterized protein (DUF111 family)